MAALRLQRALFGLANLGNKGGPGRVAEIPVLTRPKMCDYFLKMPATLPPFSVRPACPDDLKAIWSIERQVQAAPWSLDHFNAELEKPYARMLVMTDDETDEVVVGYCCARFLDGKCEILTIGVGVDFRRQGYGRLLLDKTLSEAYREGFRLAVLEVRKSNEAAIQLYQQRGFAIVSVRKGFYSNGEDAYHMQSDLDAPDSND